MIFRLSIDISEESETVEGSDDKTYYPSFNISIGYDFSIFNACNCEV